MNPGSIIEDHPSQAFTCYASRFKAYKAEIIDGSMYVVGVGARGDGQQTFYVDSCQRTGLLVSLLTLYERLTPDLYGYVEERITDVDTARVLDWCIRYGMPMEEKGDLESLAGNSIWMKYRQVGFHLTAFYNRLHDLYTCYELWRRVTFNDTDKSNFYAETPIKQCREFLNVRMLTMNVRLRPNFECDPPSFFLECDDYMAVAKAQMFFLCMTSGVPYVGVCSVCGSPFAKMRKNHNLCEECQRTKYQRSREKKRIAEQREANEGRDD